MFVQKCKHRKIRVYSEAINDFVKICCVLFRNTANNMRTLKSIGSPCSERFVPALPFQSLSLLPLILLIENLIDFLDQIIILKLFFEVLFNFRYDFTHHSFITSSPILLNCRPFELIIPGREFLETARNILIILHKLLKYSNCALDFFLICWHFTSNHIINSLIENFQFVQYIVTNFKIKLIRFLD